MKSIDIVLLAIIGFMGACSLADRALQAYRMRTRAKNIAAAGWPPAHVDADGNPVAWENEEEAA